MGHELYRMIRDGAPATWTALMRLVAMAIADDARDPSQGGPEDGGWPWSALPVVGRYDSDGEWRDGLTERTGATADGVSHALTRLARSGYEMREQIGTDSRGRPVFAAKGHATRFRVPLLPPRPEPERSPRTAGVQPLKGRPNRPPLTSEADAKGRSNRRQRSGIRASKVGDSADPISPGPPNSPPTAKSSAVNSPVEGSQGALDQDQYFSGDEGKGTCSVCGQQAALKRSMTGPFIANHSRDREGEKFCPGTGEPPAPEGAE